jgi:signal transduction histidine kinase
VTFELSPPILYDLGLKEALSWLAEDVERRCAMTVELEAADTTAPLDEATAALLFRAARELLMNVFKHANVPRAKVTLRATEDHVVIVVQDGGVGFDVDDVTTRSSRHGFGLFSIHEQIQGLGGTVTIASAEGDGTRVTLTVPLRAERMRAAAGNAPESQ